jgi:hypothetical protein
MRRFRIGNFALAEGQFPIDRHSGNNKPILRLHGPIARGGIPIADINSIYTSKDPKLALSDKFNTWNSFQHDPPVTKTKKIVRVKMANGKTHLRIQTGNAGAVVATVGIGAATYLINRNNK